MTLSRDIGVPHRAPDVSPRRKLDIVRRLLSSTGNPRFASLFITRVCNFACPYCRSINHPSQDMSTTSWKNAVDKLRGWGVRMFSLTGGEPMMRPDIRDLIGHIHAKGCLCWMISNFSLITREEIDRLAAAGLQFLTCSFDSLSPAGEKSDSSVLDLLVHAKQRGIIGSTLTVVTSRNIHEIPAIVEAVTSRGIVFDMGLYQHVGGLFSPQSTQLKPLRRDVEALRRFLKRKKLRSGLIAPSWSYLSESLDRYYGELWKCPSQTDRFIVVNNDGLLMPCQEYAASISIFDIDSLDDMRWRSEKRCFVETCPGCFYGCYHGKTHTSPLDALLDAYAMLRI